jgi:hypothetical protein
MLLLANQASRKPESRLVFSARARTPSHYLRAFMVVTGCADAAVARLHGMLMKDLRRNLVLPVATILALSVFIALQSSETPWRWALLLSALIPVLGSWRGVNRLFVDPDADIAILIAERRGLASLLSALAAKPGASLIQTDGGWLLSAPDEEGYSLTATQGTMLVGIAEGRISSGGDQPFTANETRALQELLLPSTDGTADFT